MDGSRRQHGLFFVDSSQTLLIIASHRQAHNHHYDQVLDVAGTTFGIKSLRVQVRPDLLDCYDTWKSYDSDISSTYNVIIDLSRTFILLNITLQEQADEERVGRVRTCVKDYEDALLELDKKRPWLNPSMLVHYHMSSCYLHPSFNYVEAGSAREQKR